MPLITKLPTSKTAICSWQTRNMPRELMDRLRVEAARRRITIEQMVNEALGAMIGELEKTPMRRGRSG